MMNFLGDNQNKDLFSGISMDEGIDLNDLIKSSTKSENNTDKVNETKTENEKPETKPSSPLALELEKKKTQQLGVSMTRQEFEAGQEKTEFRSVAENDDRINAINQSLDDADFILKQRAAVIPLKQYENGPEYTQMIHEITLVRFDENNKPYFEYDKDDEGNIIPVTMIRLRTENDPPFSKENDFTQMHKDLRNKERIAQGKEPIANDTTEEEVDDVVSDEKKKVVQFIIDKTGLGADFALTDEEKVKLVEANEIRLTQVEVLDIESITTVKPEPESFTGNIHEYTLSGSKTTVSFPASGFKADMVGLTYGEVGDVSLSMDSITVDKYYKRLAIIYNKMKNLSCGPFDSFESFLKNIAYTDISLAMYGLYVSTFPEIQTMSLRCGRSTCNKTFDWNFGTRDILKLEKSDEVLLNHLKEIVSADPSEYDDIYKKAPVRNIKYIKLPKCGYIVGLGIASAWEFLYNFIPLLNEKTFKDAFGDDLNQIYMNNMMLLTTVLSVRVPDPKRPGTYILCEGYKDILDAIYHINPEEIKILSSISYKIQREYQVNFSFGDVVCPHCHNVTKDLELTIDELV